MGDGDTAVAKVMEVDGSSIKYMNPMVKMRGDSDNEVDLNSPKLAELCDILGIIPPVSPIHNSSMAIYTILGGTAVAMLAYLLNKK